MASRCWACAFRTRCYSLSAKSLLQFRRLWASPEWTLEATETQRKAFRTRPGWPTPRYAPVEHAIFSNLSNFEQVCRCCGLASGLFRLGCMSWWSGFEREPSKLQQFLPLSNSSFSHSCFVPRRMYVVWPTCLKVSWTAVKPHNVPVVVVRPWINERIVFLL